MTSKKPTPTWSDVKAKLGAFDRPGLLALVQDLHAASKDNQAFLHDRLNLGGDVLRPYKPTLARWPSPDVFKNHDTSVAKAKKVIADYKKAIGQPQGLAELMVFYCEQGASFCSDVALDDAVYLDALVRIFEQALKVSASAARSAARRLGAAPRRGAKHQPSLWLRRGRRHGPSAG